MALGNNTGNHITALKERHTHLNNMILTEMRRPLPDTATILSLKREKLRLKDLINSLESDDGFEKQAKSS